MINNIKNPLLLIASVIGLCSGVTETAQAVTYSVGLVQTNGQSSLGLPDYSQGNGGEFTIYQNDSAPSGYQGFFDVSSYSTLTRNLGNSTNDPSFQTFCVEIDENFASPVYATINAVGQALLGGANTNAGDFISVGTAYLYRLFARGELSGYFNSNRQSNARLLQQAFWFLEDEISNGQQGLNLSTNPFLDLLYDSRNNGGSGEFGSLAAARANNAPGGYGVYVLNNVSGTSTYRQDMLYYNQPAQSTPEGGATLILMGAAFGGLGLVRRYIRRA